ncbi:MAG: PilZ domain-containing protein [Gemmataceae bacterium]|nr:PilZ domain-containing protein [Gemmataceae bacterium]
MLTLPANVSIAVPLRDISSHGIGLISDEALQPGAFLRVHLDGSAGFSRTLRAQVIHATPQRDDTWILGCVLVDKLRPHEMELLV